MVHELTVHRAKSKRRYYVTCTCGFRSEARATPNSAVNTVSYHADKVRASARNNGMRPPVVRLVRFNDAQARSALAG